MVYLKAFYFHFNCKRVAVQNQMDRLLKCPACSVQVPSSYLHEHYKNHFLPSGEPIKVEPKAHESVENKSLKSTELHNNLKDAETHCRCC